VTVVTVVMVVTDTLVTVVTGVVVSGDRGTVVIVDRVNRHSSDSGIFFSSLRISTKF
jgi:hypothetical protein